MMQKVFDNNKIKSFIEENHKDEVRFENIVFDDKEALARRKAEGVILGRPKGSKSAKTKLTGKENEIKKLLDKKVSHSAISRILGVHRLTVAKFVKEKMAVN